MKRWRYTACSGQRPKHWTNMPGVNQDGMFCQEDHVIYNDLSVVFIVVSPSGNGVTVAGLEAISIVLAQEKELFMPALMQRALTCTTPSPYIYKSQWIPLLRTWTRFVMTLGPRILCFTYILLMIALDCDLWQRSRQATSPPFSSCFSAGSINRGLEQVHSTFQ